MSRIFWDSMLFVYWFENHPHYAARVEHIRARMQERNDEWLTSALVVGEVLTLPYRTKAELVAREMEEFFASRLIQVLPFTSAAALRYASIRASLVISRPDAVHLACAAEAGTDLFLTNDKALLGKTVPGVQFIDDIETRLL